MTYHDLNRRLYDRPFRPFRIKLSNSTALDVLEPWQLQVGETSAILPVEVFPDKNGHPVVRNWKTISIAHIAELTDLTKKSNGNRKRA